MFLLGLMTLSWLKINIKKKTENGHCLNPAHEPKENKPTGCSIGSKFHKRLYDDYLRILEDFVKASKGSSPTALPSLSKKKDDQSL
jgi:hypothetical protein